MSEKFTITVKLGPEGQLPYYIHVYIFNFLNEILKTL